MWAKVIGGSEEENINDIHINVAGNILLAGQFESPTLVFSPYTIVNAVNNGITNDAFFTAMDKVTGEFVPEKEAGEWTLFPNPAGTEVHVRRLKADCNADVKILDEFGRILQMHNLQHGLNSISFDLKTFSAGVYFVMIATEEKLYSFRFIKL